MISLRSPDASSSAQISTPEAPPRDTNNDECIENNSDIANTNISARKYLVCHPHETSADYNLRVQWQRKGKWPFHLNIYF